MKTRLAVAMVALLWCIGPASAHRLDEFLQATTIAVEKNQITVQVRLTPGIAVVPAVLADIDADRNGIISDAERRSYAERVLRDLSLTLDGGGLPLRLVATVAADVAEIEQGLGAILLTFRADVPQGARFHRLSFENHYKRAVAAYLVNCLLPNDPDIRITAQDRKDDQSFYQVDYTQAVNVQPNPADAR